MPKRFAATESAIEKGLEETSPTQGAKLARDWMTELEGVELAGAKGLHGDLERLAKELDADAPNGDRIVKLLGKLGPATQKLAERCEDEKVAEKIRSLGDALASSGVEAVE